MTHEPVAPDDQRAPYVDVILISHDGDPIDAWPMIEQHLVTTVLGYRPDARFAEVFHRGQLVDVFAMSSPNRILEDKLRTAAADSSTPERSFADLDRRSRRSGQSAWWLDRELAAS